MKHLVAQKKLPLAQKKVQFSESRTREGPLASGGISESGGKGANCKYSSHNGRKPSENSAATLCPRRSAHGSRVQLCNNNGSRQRMRRDNGSSRAATLCPRRSAQLRMDAEQARLADLTSAMAQAVLVDQLTNMGFSEGGAGCSKERPTGEAAAPSWLAVGNTMGDAMVC